MSERLTDEELDQAEQAASDQTSRAARVGVQDYAPARLTLRLVAEVRRLRGDAWLAAAAEEIADAGQCEHGWDYTGVCRDGCMEAILKRHRDGA